MTDTHNTLSV